VRLLLRLLLRRAPLLRLLRRSRALLLRLPHQLPLPLQ